MAAYRAVAPAPLGDLAATFDELLGRLEHSFEAQRRFVASASHELRTPLTLERALMEVALADANAASRASAWPVAWAWACRSSRPWPALTAPS